MFGAILKATNSYFQKGIAFCRSIYLKKVMKLLAFKFEQSSYLAGATIQVANLVNYNCHPSSGWQQEHGNKVNCL